MVLLVKQKINATRLIIIRPAGLNYTGLPVMTHKGCPLPYCWKNRLVNGLSGHLKKCGLPLASKANCFLRVNHLSLLRILFLCFLVFAISLCSIYDFFYKIFTLTIGAYLCGVLLPSHRVYTYVSLETACGSTFGGCIPSFTMTLLHEPIL